MTQTRDTARAESTVATLLRQTRQISGLDLAEVSRALRIRRVYLEAIEAGRYDYLPGAPYVVGFVRAYAEHLHLNGDQVVRRLREETPLSPAFKRPEAPRTPSESGTPKGAVLIIGAVLALAAYGGWYVLSSRDSDVVQLVMPVPKRLEDSIDRTEIQRAIDNMPPAGEEDEPAPTPATESDTADEGRMPSSAPVTETPETTVSTSAKDAGPTAQPSSGSPAAFVDGNETTTPEDGPSDTPLPDSTDAASEPDPADVGVYGPPAPVVLRATADCWIEVRDNARNRLVFARLLSPGDTYNVVPRPELTLLAGNAGGLEAIVDGINRGTLGRPGEVRRDVDLDPQRLTESAAAPTVR